jgi:AcrR family transcriptional regulator
MGTHRSTSGPSVQIPRGPTPAPALPLAGVRRERADAAANRRRILDAARRLLREQGAEGLTMQAVATEAGVGKGTVFHRFGDRDGLTAALIDDYMRVFQDEFLHGDPPLGPGAPPRERLEAFFSELVDRQVAHLELALAAERTAPEQMSPAYATLIIHISSLIRQIDPDLDAPILAPYLLSAVGPPVLNLLHTHSGVTVAQLQRAAVQLVRGVTAPQSS